MKKITRPQREPTTTITVSVRTAETVRKLVGEMQLRTGKTITQRMVIDAALEAYMEKLREEKK
jgi:DNA-dependent RNA polymerase auxiliary subunit epsilon